MAIKKKIDNLTSNLLLSVSRISVVRTILNALSTVFQARAIKYAYLALFVLFTTGIVNALVEGGSYAIGAPIIPNFQGQTLAESVILSASVLCGTVGFILITRATKQVTKGRTTAAFIISGLGLSFIGLVIGFFLVTLKGG
tara:strand:- start:1642 stop:2064 length:423 start_codon:yes stop_codon:yes gene_type:complete